MLFRRFVAYLCASVFTGECQHLRCGDPLEGTDEDEATDAVTVAAAEKRLSTAVEAAAPNATTTTPVTLGSTVPVISPFENVKVKVCTLRQYVVPVALRQCRAVPERGVIDVSNFLRLSEAGTPH